MRNIKPPNKHGLKVAGPVLIAGAAGIALLASAGDLTPPPGPPAPTMKTLTEVEPRTPVESLLGDAEALYLIDQPGSYYLTGNITGVSGLHGIKIDADDVTLDLNGFALYGGTGSESAVFAYERENLVVRNGTVDGWEAATHGYAVLVIARNGRLEGLHVSNTGAGGIRAVQCTVAACSASNTGGGISVEYGTILNCFANDCYAGIGASWGSTVTNCTAVNSDTYGFGGSKVTFAHCTAHSNGGDGFGVTDGIVKDCTSVSNTGDGFSVTGGSVMNCTSASNTGDGIEVADRCYVMGNTCKDNGTVGSDGAGIHVTGQSNRIEGNHAIGNYRGFLVDGTGNLIIKNTASYNAHPTYFYIDVGNTYGPVILVGAGGDLSGISGADHPWANFGYDPS